MEVENICAVYLVTFSGGFKHISYFMTRDDAMKFCGDKCSKGVGWHFQFTSLENMIENKDSLNNLKIVKDNGKQKADLIRLNIIPISREEVEKCIENMDY